MTTTVTDSTLLQLVWLASPALPVGGFSYSEGLEPAVEQGLVHDEASAGAWLDDQLALGQARCELPLLARAMLAWQADEHATAETLNRWMLQTRETAELRRQTEQMGRSMSDWLGKQHPPSPALQALARFEPAPTWPLAFALAAVLAGAAPRPALLAFAFGWAENMVQAALKAVPLGQSAGQRILGRLAAQIPAAVAQALALPEDGRQAFTPMLAILSAQHETQYSRLFRS